MIEHDIESNIYQCYKCKDILTTKEKLCERCEIRKDLFRSVSLIVVSMIFLGSIIKFI